MSRGASTSQEETMQNEQGVWFTGDGEDGDYLAERLTQWRPFARPRNPRRWYSGRCQDTRTWAYESSRSSDDCGLTVLARGSDNESLRGSALVAALIAALGRHQKFPDADIGIIGSRHARMLIIPWRIMHQELLDITRPNRATAAKVDYEGLFFLTLQWTFFGNIWGILI